jgi:hypothetical protein
MRSEQTRFEVYRETFYSPLVIVFFVLAQALLAYYLFYNHKSYLLWSIELVLVFVFLSVFSLTTYVDDEYLYLIKGITGFFYTEIELKDIQTVVLSQSPLLNTTLYAPHHHEIVELQVRDLGKVTIASDDRARLVHTLRARIEQRR